MGLGHYKIKKYVQQLSTVSQLQPVLQVMHQCRNPRCLHRTGPITVIHARSRHIAQSSRPSWLRFAKSSFPGSRRKKLPRRFGVHRRQHNAQYIPNRWQQRSSAKLRRRAWDCAALPSALGRYSRRTERAGEPKRRVAEGNLPGP